MSYSVRKATLDDIPELIDLTYRAYEPIRQLNINFKAANPTTELVTENLTENQCFILLDGETIISTVSVRMPWSKNPGPYGLPHIWWFATSPTSGKRGAGSYLLNYVEQEIILKEWHSPAVSLGTARNHPWLIDMYIRKDYVSLGSRDSGMGHTTQFMVKVLDHDRFKGFQFLRKEAKDNIVFESGDSSDIPGN